MPRFPAGWQIDPDGKRVSTRVKTRDFLDALDLFQEIGDVAEEIEHHPDLHVEKYNEVRIVSYSHDVGGLTERDETLAARIQELLQERGLVK